MSSKTHQALVLDAQNKPLRQSTLPIPTASPGSAIIQVLVTNIGAQTRNILSGKIPGFLKTPVVPSAQTIGRIHSVGPDSTSLQVGQLVFVDFYTRSRDNSDHGMLQGYISFTPEGAKLMGEEWGCGTFGQYARMPLENIFPLNEDVLVNKLGYSFGDLSMIGPQAVAMGGLSEVEVHPGDTVIVAPATGLYGGTCVQVALALGARVIAAGRNAATLDRLQSVLGASGRLSTVKLVGDVEADAAALKNASGSESGADIYVDWSPPTAAKSTHYQSCLAALRPWGRAVLNGAPVGNVEIPYALVMAKSLRIQGRLMFDRVHVRRLISMIESGLLKLGSGEGSGVTVEAFKMEQIESALEHGEKDVRWGQQVVMEM